MQFEQAMPGPGATPTSLKLLSGSADQNPSRVNKAEPKPGGLLGKPPKALPADQKAVWKQEAKRCFWATEADRGAFEILVRNVAKARKLAKELETEDVIIKGSRGMVRNPKSYELRECEDRATRIYGEFGMTPSSRTKVHAPEKPKPGPGDAFRDKGRT